MTFADYIGQQQHRLDLVGDFARFLLSEKPRIGGYLQIKQWLYEHEGADDSLYDALEQAHDELAVLESRRRRLRLAGASVAEAEAAVGSISVVVTQLAGAPPPAL